MPGKPAAVGPSLAGITVVEGGKRRPPKVYSPFNHYRPGAPAQTRHRGEDIECPTGVPQRALTVETVVKTWDHGTVGGYNQALLTYLPQLKLYVLRGHIRAGVSKLWGPGKTIHRGQIVCYGGTSADAMNTAPHLHLQCSYDRDAALALGKRFNDAAVDPRTHFRAKLREFPLPVKPAEVSDSVVKDFDPEAPEHRIELRCGDGE